MKNVMKRAWEIYRTLAGDHSAKLAMALKAAWAEIKNAVKSVKDQIIARIELICANSCSCYNYTVVAKDWENYGKNRTYLSVTETSSTKHFKKFDFGYIDNATNTYVPGTKDAMKNYVLHGSSF